MYIDRVGVLDVDEDRSKFIIESTKGTFIERAENLGQNSLQQVLIGRKEVKRLTYDMSGGSAITSIVICDATAPDPTTTNASTGASRSGGGSCISEGIPLQSVFESVGQRLTKAAYQFKNAVAKSPSEESNGVVIYVEPISVAVPVGIYTDHIRNTLSMNPMSISVMTNPLCVTSSLENGEKCIDYVDALVGHLRQEFPHVGDAPDGQQKFPIEPQLCASTAGIISRLTRAKSIICAPRSPTCLMPALSMRKGQTAVLLQTENNRQPREFFDMMGFDERVLIKDVDENVSPAAEGVKIPPKSLVTTNKRQAASIFYKIANEKCQIKVARPTSTCEAFRTDNQQVLATISEKIEVGQTSAVSTVSRRGEAIPSKEDLLHHLKNKIPWSVNYAIPVEERNGGKPQDVSKALGKETDTLLRTRVVTQDDFEISTGKRHQSRQRIKQLFSELEAKEGVWVNPSLHMEVECPASTPEGGRIDFTETGTVITNHKADAALVTVSDGAGTVTFTKPTLKASTERIERKDGAPFVVLTDPQDGSSKTFTGIDQNYNAPGQIPEYNGAGGYSYDSNNEMAVLKTEGGTGSPGDRNERTIYDRKSVTTGSGRSPGSSVVRSQRGYAVRDQENPDAPFNGFAQTPYNPVDTLIHGDENLTASQQQYNYVGVEDVRGRGDEFHSALTEDGARRLQTYLINRKKFKKTSNHKLLCDQIRRKQQEGETDGYVLVEPNNNIGDAGSLRRLL